MNNKLSLSLAALTAVGLFAIYSAPAFAAVGATVPPKQPGCTVNCTPPGGNDPADAGDPWFPPGGDDPEDGDDPKDGPEDGDDPEEGGGPDGGPEDGDVPEDGGPGGDPDYPGLSKQAAAELRACLARLDGLPQVSETQVNQFGQPYKVTLNPVCEAKSLTDVQPILVEGGNVAGLEPAIKGNAAIKSKLGESAYKARDVVGIDFDANGNAILFVHKRG